MDVCKDRALDARKRAPLMELPPRVDGRKCRSNLFNEVSLAKRPKHADCASEDEQEHLPLSAEEMQSLALALQFVFPWLPYQCLVRMQMTIKSPLFVEVMRKTVTRLHYSTDEQSTRKARVKAFELFQPDRPDVPAPFFAIRKHVSADDFPNTAEIVLRFSPRLDRFEPRNAHAVPPFDADALTNIAAFKRLTHLFLSVEPTTTKQYWRHLPISLEHLCIARRPQTVLPRTFNLSKLANLKSLSLQSNAAHGRRPNLTIGAFPSNLQSLMIDFDWVASALCLLPPALKIFDCHNLLTGRDECVDELVANHDDRVVPTLAHIGISGVTFDIGVLDYFPPSVTSVSLPERCKPTDVITGVRTLVGSTVQYTGGARSWKRLVLTTAAQVLDTRPFTIPGLDESLVSLHMNAPIDNLSSHEWSSLSRFNHLKILSLRGNVFICDTVGDVCMPPLLESLSIAFIGHCYPVRVAKTHTLLAIAAMTKFMSCFKFGPLIKTLHVDVFDGSVIDSPHPLVLCPEFSQFAPSLPQSLSYATLTFRHVMPSFVAQSSVFDKRVVLTSVEALKRRGVKVDVFFRLDASCASSHLRRHSSHDDVLDDFDASTARKELTWCWDVE